MIGHLILMAGNNRWSNARLHAACIALQPGEWEAPRVGFFPSLVATLHHIHEVDLYYLDALTEGGKGARVWDEAPVFATAADLARAQAALDESLIAFCRALTPDRRSERVVTDRGPAGRLTERVDFLLLHLFQHQVHHRGQAHAMLSGTSVRPPQLDEFFLGGDRDPAAQPFFG